MKLIIWWLYEYSVTHGDAFAARWPHLGRATCPWEGVFKQSK